MTSDRDCKRTVSSFLLQCCIAHGIYINNQNDIEDDSGGYGNNGNWWLDVHVIVVTARRTMSDTFGNKNDKSTGSGKKLLYALDTF